MPGLYALRQLAPAGNRATSPQVSLRARLDRQQREDRPPPNSSKAKRLPSGPVTSALHIQASVQTIRPKQVTDPLTEPVKARIITGVNEGWAGVNYGSSGSDHEPSSGCLVAMVQGFMEESVGSCGHARCNCVNGSCNGEGVFAEEEDNEEDKESMADDCCQILEDLVSSKTAMELVLLEEVKKAMEVMNRGPACKIEGAQCTSGCSLRSLMTHLRHMSFNAAICKSRWEHTGGFPAGDYEYIDVIINAQRLIVDMNFKAQFEIARATKHYKNLLQTLPDVFVGTPDRIKHILNIICNAAKSSMKKERIYLPPWRKRWYMQAKWFSSYKRTVNEEPPTHMNSEETLKKEFSSIALRGSQFNSKYTKGLEALYERTKEGCNESRKEERAKLSAQMGLQRQLMGVSDSDSRKITVMSTDWELPEVKPRTRHRGEVVFGLANALKEAGINTLSRLTTKQDQHEEMQSK